MNVDINSNIKQSHKTSHSKDKSPAKVRKSKNNAVGAEIKYLFDFVDLSKQN